MNLEQVATLLDFLTRMVSLGRAFILELTDSGAKVSVKYVTREYWESGSSSRASTSWAVISDIGLCIS